MLPLPPKAYSEITSGIVSSSRAKATHKKNTLTKLNPLIALIALLRSTSSPPEPARSSDRFFNSKTLPSTLGSRSCTIRLLKVRAYPCPPHSMQIMSQGPVPKPLISPEAPQPSIQYRIGDLSLRLPGPPYISTYRSGSSTYISSGPIRTTHWTVLLVQFGACGDKLSVVRAELVV